MTFSLKDITGDFQKSTFKCWGLKFEQICLIFILNSFLETLKLWQQDQGRIGQQFKKAVESLEDNTHAAS